MFIIHFIYHLKKLCINRCILILFYLDKATVPPVFIENLTAQKLEEGDPLTFICKVTGTPDPDIEWYRDGKVMVIPFYFGIVI